MSDPKSKPVLMTYIRGLIQMGQVTNINYNYISLHLFLAQYCVCVLMTAGLDVSFCMVHFSSSISIWVETKTEKIEQQIFSKWGFRGICKLERQILLHSSDLAVLRPTVYLGSTNNFFLFSFLCLIWHVIKRYGRELSTVRRWASNSQYWLSYGTLNF